jgi:hypothetical protein
MLTGAVAAILLALVAPAANAGSPATSQGYPCATAPAPMPGSTAANCGHKRSSGVAGQAKTVHAPATRPHAARLAGVLPFTGLQLGVVVAVALLLVLAGAALRASGRKRPTA